MGPHLISNYWSTFGKIRTRRHVEKLHFINEIATIEDCSASIESSSMMERKILAAISGKLVGLRIFFVLIGS